MKALVIAPYDGTALLDATNIIAKTIVECLRKEEFDVTFIGKQPTRANLPEQKWNIICYVGHGTEKTLYPDDPALFDDTNIEYCEGAFVLAISCSSARWLGMTAVSKGATAFLGFNNEIYLPLSTKDHGYLSDFTRTYILIPLSILRGQTVHQAWKNFRQICEEYAQKYENERYDMFSRVMASWMRFNLSSIAYHGNPTTTLGLPSMRARYTDDHTNNPGTQ